MEQNKEVKQVVAWVWIDGSVQIGVVRPTDAQPLATGDIDAIKKLFDAELVKRTPTVDNIIDYCEPSIRDAETQMDKYVAYIGLLNKLRTSAAHNATLVSIATANAANRKKRREAIQTVQRRMH